MEVHAAPAVGKRMWAYLRAVFYMVRKGLLANKRRLLLGMHLLMKRRSRAVERTVAALLSHHHHHAHGHGRHRYSNALRRREYEFSCSNSPDPAGRRLAYFPCLGALAEDELTTLPDAPPLARIEYNAAASSPAPSSPGLLLSDLAPGEEMESCCASPALCAAADGGFSVRVSDYSSEDEIGAGGSEAVDDEAEEFIRRFYEQLRRQNTVALLPYYLQETAA